MSRGVIILIILLLLLVGGVYFLSSSAHEVPLTKFEARGLRLGHGVWDLLFTRPSAPSPSPP